MTSINVILVDEYDRVVGTMEKIEVHEKGLLHRAVTVYVFNSRHQLLLQQRAADKYHCGGLWSNTCCGHPYPNEGTRDAAQRRLDEEMGLSCDLVKAFHLSYNLTMDNGLIEHEFGHVFFSISDSLPVLNPEEAQAFRYLSLSQVRDELDRKPEAFSPWFHHTFPRAHKAFARFLDSNAAGRASVK